VRFCSRPSVLVGVLEGEGAQGIDPLAAGEHEQGGGAGHLGDVVAVANEGRAALRAVQVAEIQPVVGGDHQIGHVGMGVEEGEGFLEQAVRVVRACSRRG
jgi:hypothetical protein